MHQGPRERHTLLHTSRKLAGKPLVGYSYGWLSRSSLNRSRVFSESGPMNLTVNVRALIVTFR